MPNAGLVHPERTRWLIRLLSSTAARECIPCFPLARNRHDKGERMRALFLFGAGLADKRNTSVSQIIICADNAHATAARFLRK